MHLLRSPIVRCFTVGFLSCLVAAPAWASLPEYIKKPEPKFERKLREKLDLPQGRVYDLHVASQVWQDIPWTHQVQVYQPKEVNADPVMFVFNTGGKANPGMIAFGLDLAQKMKATVAIIFDKCQGTRTITRLGDTNHYEPNR